MTIHELKNLMIDDFVYSRKHNQIVRVWAVHPDYIQCYVGGLLTEIGNEYIDPIELTEDVLTKNGLKRKEKYKKYEWSANNVEIWVILGDSDEEGKKRHVIHIEDERCGTPVRYHNTISYIHEVQNALYLCRIEKEITL